MNRLVGLVLILFIVMQYSVPTFSATSSASQLLYVKHWYGATYYFYSDKVVVADGLGDNITLYNELGAVVSRLNLTSYQLLISRNNVTYYYHIDITLFGKSYAFNILVMFLFSETGTCKIKVTVYLPIRIPKWIGKALFKWRLPGEFKQHGYRLIRKRLFIDFSDMARHGVLGRIHRGNNYYEVESTGFNSKIIIDPVIGVMNGTRYFTANITNYVLSDNLLVNPGFEYGNTTGWDVTPYTTSITYSVSTSQAYNGTYSLEVYTPSTGEIEQLALKQLYNTSNPETYMVELHIYPVVAPTEIDVYLWRVDSTGSPTALAYKAVTTELSLNTWNTIVLTPDVSAGMLEIDIIANGTCDVYLDAMAVYMAVQENYVVNGTNTYTVYSVSNATYTYLFNATIALKGTATILVPKGYTIVNATINNTQTSPTEQDYNTTYKTVSVTLQQGLNIVNITFTAWNSITDLYTDYKYYPYGTNVTIHARLLDPYLNPISGENITYWVGVNYTVQAIIADGYYEEYNVTTDQNGWANLTITTPNNDAEITIQAEYNGSYVGVRNTTVYSTGYVWSITYTPSTAVRKGENITLEFSITRTVDNSKPDGWLYIVFNNTSYRNEVRNGYAYRVFTSNISGEWNLTILGFRDVDAPTNTSIDKVDTLVWCGVDITYSVYPAKYYYNINETVTVNYYISYDTGQTRNWTITVLQNGNTIYIATGYRGSFTVRLDRDNNITINVLELDNKTTASTITIHALHINVEGYMVSSINGTNILYMHAWLSDKRSIIGAYTIGIYGAPTNKTIDYYDASKYTIQLFFTEINTTALRIDVAITNLETVPRDYTVTITVKPYYFGGVSYNVSTTIHVEPYRNNYTSLVMLFDNTSYGIIMYYELNVTVNGEITIYKNNLPYIVGYGLYDQVEILQGFSRKSEISIVSPVHHITTLVIMTPVGLVSKPYNVSSTMDIVFNVTVDTNRIYESGEELNITVTMSSTPFPAEIHILFNGITYSYEAGNKTYSIIIPSLPAYVFQTYPVTISLLIANTPVKQRQYTVMIYNSGPRIILVSPSEYSQLNGTVTITLYVYDPSGVESVLWKWDFEDSWHNASIDGYYAYITYDTLKIQNGLARLMVKATDKHGYTSDAVYYFNIYNAVNEARMNQLLYNIGQFISRYIFVPGLITGVLTTVIGMWIGYAFRKRREQKEKIVVVLQKGVNKK